MFLTIDGIKGGLSELTAEKADNLAKELLQAGYSIRINGLRVNLQYGPGYNYVTWGEGDYMDQSIDPESL